MLTRRASAFAEAAELIRNAKRPLILPGTALFNRARWSQVRALAERAQIPVASTLLGLGGFPASHHSSWA